MPTPINMTSVGTGGASWRVVTGGESQRVAGCSKSLLGPKNWHFWTGSEVALAILSRPRSEARNMLHLLRCRARKWRRPHTPCTIAAACRTHAASPSPSTSRPPPSPSLCAGSTHPGRAQPCPGRPAPPLRQQPPLPASSLPSSQPRPRGRSWHRLRRWQRYTHAPAHQSARTPWAEAVPNSLHGLPHPAVLADVTRARACGVF